ncbi:hypothetical protein BG006_001709 [Podila minutissima]|uniref:Uncharacterized protein n=1 Tax=Podila minutissima TaxID=64525 RepID=A0A9P5SDH8_9FUNG|nr:hypothetical protein BG006_001709 [Podila minutissima]
MTTAPDLNASGIHQANGQHTSVPTPGPSTDDIDMENEHDADQAHLDNLLQQQRDATAQKATAARKVMDTPAGPALSGAEKELKAATLELTHIKRNIALLRESIAEMADLASLDSVTIQLAAPAPVVAAIGSGAVEETVLAKIRPLKVPTDAPCFLPGTVPRLFLDDLQSKVSTFIGQDAFDEDCKRYLLYLTNVPHIRTSVKDSLVAMTQDPALSHWEWCEALFLLHALSEHERMMELNNLLSMGLLPGETYQQFAIRVAHDTHIYGVKDDNEIPR